MQTQIKYPAKVLYMFLCKAFSCQSLRLAASEPPLSSVLYFYLGLAHLPVFISTCPVIQFVFLQSTLQLPTESGSL